MGLLILVALIVMAVVALIPAVVVYRRKNLLATDVALFVVPAVLFLVALSTFNATARDSLAPVLVVEVLAVSVFFFYLRVFLLPVLKVPPRAASLGVLIVCSLLAVHLGMTTEAVQP